MKEHLHKRVPLETAKSLLDEYHQGRIPRREVCRYLKIGKSRFFDLYRIFLRAEIGGAAFTLFKERKTSGHQFSSDVQKHVRQELESIRSLPAERRRFNFEVIAEEVHKRLGYRIHRNCIRRFAIREGFYSPHQDKTRGPYRQFEMGSIGMMFQHDDSPHLWIPSLRRRIDLIATVDDHSRRILKGTLVDEAGAWEHMCHAEAVSRLYGLPGIWYLDHHSIFTYRFAHKSLWREQKVDQEGETQFSLMMAELGVLLRFAPTPQAKGKIENKFKYLQGRVPYLCDKHHVRKLEEGQKIVDEVVDYYDTKHVHEETGEIPLHRWDRAIQEGRTQLRPVPEDIDWDYVSAFKCSRWVDGYGTISVRGSKYKLRAIRNQRVTVCEKPGVKISVYDGKHKIATFYEQR